MAKSHVLNWLGPLTFLGIFFFYPIIRILAVGLVPSFLVSAPQFISSMSGVLWFTFYQAFLSTVLTLLVGLPLAYLFARLDFPAKPIFRALTAIPFMLPTVVVAAGFTALFGPRGLVNLVMINVLRLDQPPLIFVGTLGAILTAHIFYNATIVIRIVGNAWASLDVRLTDASRSLGASRFQSLVRITLPLLRPSIFAASLLIFLFDFTSYGVILLLGGPHFATIEVEIYIQALQMLNLPAAAGLSLIQLLCTLIFSAVYSRYISRVTSVVRPRAAWTNLRKRYSPPHNVFIISMVVFMLVFFALPLLALPARSISVLDANRAQQIQTGPHLTTSYYTELFVNRRGSLFYVPPFTAVRNSLSYAGLTVLISLILGFPAASALSRPGKLEKWIDPLLMLPLGASAVTLGLGYIITFNRSVFLSNWSLLTSPWLIPLVHTTIALPFVIRNLQTALSIIPNRYREAAAVLGASRWQIWKNIDVPIIARAIISAGAFAFTISLGEFGAASLLARPEYPTIPTAIYRFLSQPGTMNYGQAMAMATILMFICGCGILLIEKMRFPGTSDF